MMTPGAAFSYALGPARQSQIDGAALKHVPFLCLPKEKGTKRKGTLDLPLALARGSLRFSQQAALGNSSLRPSNIPRSIPPTAAMLGSV
jgi:hypothetical protein